MDISSIPELIASKRSEIQVLKTDIAALERAYELVTGEQLSDLEPVANLAEYGALLKAVQAAVDAVPHVFTIREVVRVLEKISPGLDASNRLASISTTLKSLAEKGKLNVLESGKGRNPTVYSRILEMRAST
jgi:hypothetical protein